MSLISFSISVKALLKKWLILADDAVTKPELPNMATSVLVSADSEAINRYPAYRSKTKERAVKTRYTYLSTRKIFNNLSKAFKAISISSLLLFSNLSPEMMKKIVKIC
jgi:hypothetical protein